MEFRVETDRLIMRNFELKDETDALEYLGDEETMYYIEDVFDMDKTRKFIKNYGMDESPYVYALELKEESKVIGHIIFHEYDDERIYELGFIINRKSQGKGYAKEICEKLIEYAFKNLGLHKIVAETIEGNIKSQKLIEKLGLKKEATLRKHNYDHDEWVDEYHYGLLEEEFEK